MSDYAYKRKITIDSSKVDATLTDYPLMVILNDVNFNFANVRSDGYDFRFYASDGVTALSYEREYFNKTEEKAVFHVRVPSVSSSANTEIWMHYGYASATDGQNTNDVWDNNFVMVQHMGDSLVDSTGNGNNGTATGTTVVDTDQGRVRRFNGTTDVITCIDNGNLNFNGNTDSYTILTVHKSGTTGQTAQRIIEKRVTGAYPYSIQFDGSNGLILVVYDGTNAPYPTLPTQLDNVLHINTMRVNNATDKVIGNKDGGSNVEVANTTTTSTANAGSIKIGNDQTGNTGFAGDIYEIRISNIARSDAWVKADNYNIRTNTLASLGAEEVTKTAVSMELIQAPDKTTYFLNESIDLTGALIEITYSDDSTEQIQPTSVSGFDSSTEDANQEVTVDHLGFSDSFYVTILHDYRIGQIITIKFTDNLIGDVSGNESAFKVKGKELQWWNGPDNNGPLIDKEYSVASVVPHPIFDTKHIRLITNSLSRFHTVEGDLIVEYDASLGNLAGAGGPVQNFVAIFTPMGLIPVPNPGEAEHISTSITNLEVSLIRIYYKDGLNAENIAASIADLQITLTNTGGIDP